MEALLRKRYHMSRERSGVEKSSTHVAVSEQVDQTADGKKQALVKRKQKRSFSVLADP